MNVHNFIEFTMFIFEQLLNMLQLSTWCHVRWGRPVLGTEGVENELGK